MGRAIMLLDSSTHTIHRSVGSAIVVLASMCLTGCGSAPDEQTTSSRNGDSKPLVYVSIPPVKYLAERVAGERARVRVLLPSGQSPHTYEPTAKQIVEIGRANVFFCVGVALERRVTDKLSAGLRNLNVVDLAKNIELRSNEFICCPAGGHQHTNGEVQTEVRHQHDHKPAANLLDPHIWMSPRIAEKMSETIRDALAKLDPNHRQVYARNQAQLAADLEQVDDRISDLLSPIAGREFFVFHPAFGYFGDAYGLRQIAVETSGKEPSAREVERLIEQAKKTGVKLIFVQPQFSDQSARIIARAIDGAVVPLDPLAEDYLSNLMHIADNIATALRSGTTKESATTG